MEHFGKTIEYYNDPLSSDNLGKLATASEYLKPLIINGRITSLLNKQIANQINCLSAVLIRIIEIISEMQ